jgi:uncharacterized protein involved in outer membrane biogenesis
MRRFSDFCFILSTRRGSQWHYRLLLFRPVFNVGERALACRGTGVAVLLMLLSYLFLPVFVKRMAIEQVQQQTGRKLDIGEVSFSPFSLALTATNVRLYEADQKTSALAVQELRVNLSMTSLFHRALVLDEFYLTAPDVHLVRYSATQHSRYNVSDVLDKIAAAPKSDAPLRFSVANIQISKGTIVFDDQVFVSNLN